MNKRQIPFLHWDTNRDGTVTARWKPSPRLRQLGWPTRNLGTCHPDNSEERDRLTLAAMAVTREVAESDARGAQAAAGDSAARNRGPKIWTVSDLIAAYKASSAWTHEISAKSRSEYGYRLAAIEAWARDGAGRSIPLVQLDQQMVIDLKETLLPASRFTCAATLRVLRLLLNWGCNRPATGLTRNPTQGVPIPGTDARQNKLTWEEAQQVAAAAEALGHPVAARAVRFAFWTLQRQGDLLKLNQMAWRPVDNADGRDRALLAGEDGTVRGFTLRQGKTKAWVGAPLPPFLHAEAEAAFKAGQWLLADPNTPGAAIPARRLQKQAHDAFAKAGFGEYQFRDLRRSGMSWMRNKGADLDDIFIISGHAVLGKRSTADVYLPADTRRACRAVAATLRTMAAQQEREEVQ